MIAIADTGFVVAVGNRKDRHHLRCVEVYHQVEVIPLPQSALTEAAYLLTRDAGIHATANLLRQFSKTKYRLIALDLSDLDRAAELLTQYADSNLDFVDATVAAIAERLGIVTVLTVDRRDFSMLRPAHIEYFHLLPEQLGQK